MRALDVLGIALLASIWGSTFLLVEEALGSLNATQIVVVRLGLAGLGLLVLAWVLRVTLPRKASTWRRLAIMGLIGQAFPWLLFTQGQETVSSALAGVYTGATPLLTIPVAWLLLRKQPSAAEFGASLIGFAGLTVILQPWASVGSAAGRGQLLCLAGAVCYALAYGYASHVMSVVPDNKVALATVQALTATAIMVPLGSAGLVDRPTLKIAAILAVVVLGLGTTVAFIVNYWLIARVGPVQASLAFYLIPPVAVAGGVVFRDERLSDNQALGFVLICLALAFLYGWERLVTDRTRRVREEHQPSSIAGEQKAG